MNTRLCFFSMLSGLLLLWSCTTPQTRTQTTASQTNDRLLQKARFGKELVEAFVPHVSPSVRSGGKVHFSYELQVANTFSLPIEITQVELYDIENREKPFFTFDSAYLSANINRPGASPAQNVTRFEGGQFGVLNLRAKGIPDELPTEFYHKLHLKIFTKPDEAPEITVEKALMSFPAPTQLTLAPPFRAGYWFYYTIGHQNTRELTEGRPTYAQRYAIDWVAIDEKGGFVDGDRSQNKSFASYGKEVLAVADGTVIDIQDSIPENPGETDERSIKLTRYNLSGNHLVLDIGNNRQVVYAHLIPNSFRVKVGDRVKAGTVLALLGNSGESTGPHLHMHLETKHKLVLGGEGLPYHFASYQQVTTFEDDIDIDSLFTEPRLPFDQTNPIRKNELPIGVGVVKFE